jgi:DNA polymerase-3 subunit delta
VTKTQAEPRPVYAIIGHDRLLRNDAVAAILAHLETDADDLGPTRANGAEAELAEVLDDVRTVSLLGSRRIVIVDDADPFISEHRQALERYCADAFDGGSLILLCNSLPKNTRLYRIIEKHGAIVACDPPKGRALQPWIEGRARTRHGKRIGAEGAQRLREHVGDEPGILDAELAKLAAYVGDRPEITPADISALTGHHREEKVFGLIDAMLAGNTAAALRDWEQVWATDRAAPGRAIAGLAWAVRRLLEVHRDWRRGVSMYALAKRMFTDANALQRRLERLSPERLEQFQRDLLDADLAVKTGLSKVDVAIEKFIVKHSVGVAAPA